MSEPFYITTAIAYPNGKPHIGHAYEAIATDAIARFQRMQGRDVRFVTGTDEHGLKMVQTARNAGRDTRAFADEMSGYFKDMCTKLNISYDCFMRTTDARHHEASVAIWKAMEASGDLYLDRYEGWYSVRDEAFYDEKELSDGEGGEKLSPQGTPVEWTKEETWFFRLSKYEKQLLELYELQPEFIRPESRRNEVMRFVEGGLKDLSVSRTSFDWGVKVPGSPDHVMYVWVDALTTYLSGIGYPDASGDFARFWPANVHIIGKDIVRFHTVYWPAFLMSAGLPLPRQVFGHGFILARDGSKMGKSAGNASDPLELAERYGVDQLRYFLLREVSFGQDGTYSEEAIVTRCNADLSNGLGNSVQRLLAIIHKNFDGNLGLAFNSHPAEGVSTPENIHYPTDQDRRDKVFRHYIDEIVSATDECKYQMERLDLTQAISALMDGMYAFSAHITNWQPWKTLKEDQQLGRHQLDVLFQMLTVLVRGFYPFVPGSVEKIWYLMGHSAESLAPGLQFSNKWMPAAAPNMLPPLVPVFPRLEIPEAADA